MPLYGGGRRSGGKQAFRSGPPTNEFGSASANALQARTARDTYAAAHADWLAEYDADPGLFIVLLVGTTETLQVRRSGGWVDARGLAVGPRGGQGPQGDPGTDAVLPPVVTEANAELGSSTLTRMWTALRVRQAATAAITAVVPAAFRAAANVARLLPTSGGAGDAHKIPQLNADGTAWELTAHPSGGATDYPEGSGSDAPDGTEPKVWAAAALADFTDGRTEPWAHEANTDPIPASKLTNAPNDGLSAAEVDARVSAGVQNWAETGNNDAIPTEKLANAPRGSGVSNSELTQAIAQASPEVDAGGALPAAAGNAAGNLFNSRGTIYELVPDGTESNIHHGTAAAKTGGFVGDDVFDWSAAAGNDATAFRLFVPNDLAGSPPAGEYHVEFVHSDGTRRGQLDLERDAALDGNGRRGYAADGDEQQVSSGAGDFTISAFSDEAHGSAASIVEGDRWVKYEQRHGAEAVKPTRLLPDPDTLDTSDGGDFPVFDPLSGEYAAGALGSGEGTTARFDQATSTWMIDLVHAGLFQTLEDDTQGIAIAASTSRVQQALTAFTDNALTLAANDHGLLLVTIDWSVSAGSTAQFSLGSDVRDTDTEFLSALRASTAYDSAAVNGLKTGEVEVFDAAGATKQGTVNFYIARNAANQVGWFMTYEPDDTPTGGLAGSIQARFRAVLLRQDAPAG